MRRWGRIALWVFALLPSVTLALLTVSLLASLGAPWPTGYSVWSGEILIPGRDSPSVHGGYYFDDMAGLAKRERKERRNSREYTLKIQQLEMQLTELRAKTSSITPPIAP
jgi:hypothetical protein